jgi:AraC family transcriptional regulator
MNTSANFVLEGVVPAVCDAEAGSAQQIAQLCKPDLNRAEPCAPQHGTRLAELQSILAELRAAIHSALDEDRDLARQKLRRAGEMLATIDAPVSCDPDVRGGLAAWQIRKVTRYIDVNLERTIRNDDLAALARLTPAHFGRAFRNSVGEPPHEYVIRRRVERAQGLMLATEATLSDIALDCGLADQSHLTRLFRRVVGESPRVWRRARVCA